MQTPLQPLLPEEVRQVAGAQYMPPIEVVIIGPLPVPICPPAPLPGGPWPRETLDLITL
jgi:hypothetical protein